MHNNQENEQEAAQRVRATESNGVDTGADDHRKLCNQVSNAGIDAADNARPKRRPAEVIIESRKRIAAGEKIAAVMRDIITELPENAFGIAVAIAPLHAYGPSKKLKTATDYAVHLLCHINKTDEQRMKKRAAEKARRERLKAAIQNGDQEAAEAYERNKRTHAEAMRRRKARMKQMSPSETDGESQ